MHRRAGLSEHAGRGWRLGAAGRVEMMAKPLDQDLAILDAYADQGVASHW
jgi:hypothetical protein